MSSKYSNLPIDILRKKINGMKNPDLSEKLTTEISSSDILSKDELLILISKLEEEIKKIKEQKKVEEERLKKERTESNAAAQLSLSEQIEKDAELERERLKQREKERIESMIIPSDKFKELKSAFGILKKDENDVNLFDSLDEQFRVELKSHESVERNIDCGDVKKKGLRLFRAKYNIRTPYMESKEFMHVNQNKGFVQAYEDSSGLLFACFRLFKNVLSDECVFSSWWIVNSTFPLAKILDETQTDESGNIILPFDFTEVSADELDSFLDEFKKSDSDNVINEIYLR